MLRKVITWVICGLMFTVFLNLESTITTSASSIIVPDDYLTIQEAINAAEPGSTIYVSAGIYYENLIIGKALTLQGESRETTIIDGRAGGFVISIDADWVNLSGFAIINGMYGISLSSSNNNITSNDVMCNGMGIILHSSNNNVIKDNNILSNLHFAIIFHSSSDNNILTGNDVLNNGESIDLRSSSNNNIINNNVSNNTGGVFLTTSSNNNTLANNNISSNGLEGVFIGESSNNYITNNIITNNGIFNMYFAPGIYLSSASNNIIKNNNLSWNHAGISISLSSKNNISGNNITYNCLGIGIGSSSDNNISDNYVSNSYVGIDLSLSSNNTIYHNNIITNQNQACDSNPANNNWHHPTMLEGNYWSNYRGIDSGGMTYPWDFTGKHLIAGDGIGDTEIPHPNLDYDYYPFINENGWIITTIEASINIDPNTLNIKSKGRWITCYITLNDPYDINDIGISTILFEDTNPAEWGDIQNDTLMVKFDRSEVEDMLSPGTYNLKVTGELADGTPFEGYSDEIRVIDPGK